MAVDRFIQFENDKPDLESIKSVLIAFFNDDGVTHIYWDDDRFYINLPGKGSFPFRDLIDTSPPIRDERWIEVYPGNPMDIITRTQDEYTNIIADGIAQMFARFWNGELDAEGCEPIKEKGD